MRGKTLKQQVAEMKERFFTEGLLDEFFTNLESIQDDENPTFVEETITVFFNESAKPVIENVEKLLEKDPVDFNTILRELHKIKGSSSSIGAVTIASKVKEARAHCEEANLESFKDSFNQMKQEIDKMKGKLEAYFELLKQAGTGK